MQEVMRQAAESQVRTHESCKQRAGMEVSIDPKGEAFCCLLHFMLLMEATNLGPQAAIQSQKDVKDPQGES